MRVPVPRIPFEEAISEPLLLKTAWQRLSVPQQTVLLAAYCVPFPTEAHKMVYTFLNGGYDHDELGYPQYDPTLPLVPQDFGGFKEVLFLSGRRSGKTSIAGFSGAYELGCGGHENYIASAENGVGLFVSQDMRTAIINLNLILSVFESSPLLSKQVLKATAEKIDLKAPETGYGRLSMMVVPPREGSTRGVACPFAICDELVEWSTDLERADPDEVVYQTLSKAQMTFPDRKLWLLSSVGYKMGLMWKAYSAGTRGSHLTLPVEKRQWANLLSLMSTTAGMVDPTAVNPHVTRDYLIVESAKPDFARECLSQWQEARSGAIEPDLLRLAVGDQPSERAPLAGREYAAAIDPAFRTDAFVFTVGHMEPDGTVQQDYLQAFEPTPGHPLDPREVFAALQPVCKLYNISLLHCDQHQAETLNALADNYGLSVFRTPLTNTLKLQQLNNINSLLRQGKLKLLSHPTQHYQLLKLQKIKSPTGAFQIRAPQGEHDDYAMSLLLLLSKIMWTFSEEPNETGWQAPTPHDECMVQAMRYREANGFQVDWSQIPGGESVI